MRASRADYSFLKDHIRYISHGDLIPDGKYLLVFAELLKPYKHAIVEPEYESIVNSKGMSNPFLFRITSAKNLEEWLGSVTVRNIGVGGLFFHFFFIDRDMLSGFATTIRRRVLKGMVGLKLLKENASVISLNASDQDWINYMSGQITREKILKDYGYDPFD